MLPFKDEFADMVHAAHVLEHFSRKEIPDVLDEWLRVLKVGGELRLEVPNLEFSAKEIVKHGGLSSGGMDVLYGQQAYETDYHKCGFTPALLKHVLQAKGLKIKRIWSKSAYEICVEAKKTKQRAGIGDGEGDIISRKSVDESIQMNNQLVKALARKEPKPKSKKRTQKKVAKVKKVVSVV